MYLSKLQNVLVQKKSVAGLNCLPKKLIKNLLPLTLSENCPTFLARLSAATFCSLRSKWDQEKISSKSNHYPNQFTGQIMKPFGRKMGCQTLIISDKCFCRGRKTPLAFNRPESFCLQNIYFQLESFLRVWKVSGQSGKFADSVYSLDRHNYWNLLKWRHGNDYWIKAINQHH